MAESSELSKVPGGHDQASDMASPECGSPKGTTATMEKVPYVPSTERSPASTASQFDQEDVDVEKSQPTPSNSSASTSSYGLRKRKQSNLVYDAKYHPMDDTIRPTQAAKRREAHGEKQVCLDSDDSSDASTVHADGEDSDNEQSEAEDRPQQPARGKKSELAQSRPLVEPTRHSPRKVSGPKVSYNMSVHPQDKFMALSSDGEERKSNKKAKKSKHQRARKPVSNDGAAVFKSGKRRYKDYVENSTSDELDSDDEHALASVEADGDALAATETSPTSPAAGHPQECIQYEIVMDTDSVYSGETCVHDDEYAWPAQPGEPFTIFIESLSDQLASEAHAFSPLEYNDEDKENATGNNETDFDPLPTHEGISVIPEAQYTETNEEREMSSHRALVSHALYDEPAPQTYGLDGAHFNGEGGHLNSEVGTPEFFLEAMKILTSGARLPM